jgi:hypothetical protein
VHLQLHFTIGPGRNWLHPWKPTIDALGKILGQGPSAPGLARWAGASSRIVDLGLHRRVDPALATTSRSPSRQDRCAGSRPGRLTHQRRTNFRLDESPHSQQDRRTSEDDVSRC